MIISGNKIAREIQSELAEVLEGWSEQMPSLHIFVIGDDSVIESFVSKKRAFAQVLGIEFIEHRFEADVRQEELEAKIRQISPSSSGASLGIVVQLPLPEHIDTQVVLDAVSTEFDVDGLGTHTAFLPPVAGAVAEMLKCKHITVAGKQALVVGRGKLVGKPVAVLLSSLGAQVSIADRETTSDELTVLCKQSDIIVSGAGVPNLITKDMVKEGSALFDAGTSTQGVTVVGDIAHDCADVAAYFSRTPGGIGPVTVAVLFKNLVIGLPSIE